MLSDEATSAIALRLTHNRALGSWVGGNRSAGWLGGMALDHDH